ncbi:MAG: phosphoserine phosphatase [Candidatus Poriferisodalaceae bacterium]|jgi:phosphoserine phosphatase
MNGHATSKHSVLFVDLDGTLVLDNSFHIFMRELWRHGDLRARARMLATVGYRVLTMGRGRVRMKHAVMHTFERLDHERRTSALEQVVKNLQGGLSLPVCTVVQRWQAEGASIVMATAAPHAYASIFASHLGFDDCLATPPTSAPDWFETIGASKAEACERWAGARASTGRIGVISDHPDDLPLMEMADSVVIQATLGAFREIRSKLSCRTSVTHIDTASAQSSGGVWLWFDGAAFGPHDKWEVRTILSKHRYALLFSEEGRWVRATGDNVASARARIDRPAPPGYKDQLAISVRRKLVRDRLGIFH